MITLPRLSLFLDQNVPDSVGVAFGEAGHAVTLLRERLAPDSLDPLVAAVSEANGAILVSHDRDMKNLARRIGFGRRKFARLSRIKLTCRESRAAARVKLLLPLIELEWSLCQQQQDCRMIVEIGDAILRFER